MREIKFRAWDEKKHIMHNDFQFVKSGNGGNDWILFVSDKQPFFADDYWTKNPHFQQQLKIMQYTGLKDKNGKDCYEKDYDEDGNMIDWCETCCGYQFKLIDIPTGDVIFCHNCEGNFMLQDYMPDFEIIGNIYENKELLK